MQNSQSEKPGKLKRRPNPLNAELGMSNDGPLRFCYLRSIVSLSTSFPSPNRFLT